MKPTTLFALLLIASLLSACARPNYQDEVTQAPLAKLTQNPCQRSFEEKHCDLRLDLENLCVNLEWLTTPIASQKNSFYLCSYAAFDAAPTNPQAQLQVQLWMPEMGHGSRPVQIKPQAPGVQLVDSVYFIMPGKWEIRIQLKEGPRVLDQVSQSIEI